MEFVSATAAEALYSAGTAINHLPLATEDAIRRAIPVAAAAAARVEGRVAGVGQFGRFTGLRIAKAQNWIYEQNRKWQFSDGTLCVLWCVEFPDAKSDYPARSHYIASTRREYNAGRHQGPAPTVPCVQYIGSGDPAAAPVRASRTARSEDISGTARISGKASAGPRPAAQAFSLHSDPAAGRARKNRLEAFFRAHVMTASTFVCSHYDECRSSHQGDFFEGQLHHVGAHYELRANGQPFRIVVVGQEVGNGPARVSIARRTRAVAEDTGRNKRFFAEGPVPARNPHMRGTTSLLRLLMARDVGRDHESEWLTVSGKQRVHIFDAFALTNFLLCSAIAAGQTDTGSKRGRSTRVMQQHCGEHFAATIRILEPTVVVSQGSSIRLWMGPLIEVVRQLSPNLERVRIAGHDLLLASFTHPSVPSAENWGTDDRRPYLLTVVAPTIRQMHHELGLITGRA